MKDMISGKQWINQTQLFEKEPENSSCAPDLGTQPEAEGGEPRGQGERRMFLTMETTEDLTS